MSIFTIVVIVLMLATFGVLVLGLIVMLRGGEVNKKYSNKLMSLRVALQAVVILLLGALFLLGKPPA